MSFVFDQQLLNFLQNFLRKGIIFLKFKIVLCSYIFSFQLFVRTTINVSLHLLHFLRQLFDIFKPQFITNYFEIANRVNITLDVRYVVIVKSPCNSKLRSLMSSYYSTSNTLASEQMMFLHTEIITANARKVGA